MHKKAGRSHLLSKKSSKRKRSLRRLGELTGGDKKRVERMLARRYITRFPEYGAARTDVRAVTRFIGLREAVGPGLVTGCARRCRIPPGLQAWGARSGSACRT